MVVTRRSYSMKKAPTDRLTRFWASNTATRSSALSRWASSRTVRETASSLSGAGGRGATAAPDHASVATPTRSVPGPTSSSSA
jgi:hypothetical protein